MTRTVKRYLIGSAIAVGLCAAFLVEEHVRGHYALKTWERQMRARGQPLSIAELAPPVTNARVRALTPGQLQGILVQSPPHEPWIDRRLIPLGKDVVLFRMSTWEAQTGGRYDWATFRAEFQPTRERLAAFRSELTNQAWVVQLPYEQGFNILLPHLSALKSAVQCLRRGMLLALHDDQLDEALGNLLAAVAVIQLEADEALAISQLVRVAGAEICLSGMVWQALLAEDWNDAQLAALQTAWERPRFLPAMARALEMERAMAGPYFQGRMQSARELASAFGATGPLGGGASDAPDLGGLKEWLGPVLETGAGLRRLAFLSLWQFAWAEQDQLFHHQAVQRVVDAARAAAAAQDVSGLVRRQGSDETPKFEVPQPFEAEKLGGWWRAKHWLSLMLLGTFDGMLEKAAHLDCRRELAVAAIALKRYHLRHQAWPPALEALVPDFLAEVPRDWMTGRPLRYRRSQDGTFALYSVGLDGVDDGGDPQPRLARNRSVYHGRDWVWAQPATDAEIAAAAAQTSRSR